MTNPLIIYHAHCHDGFTAAWVAYRNLTHEGLTPDLWPASYGEDPPPNDILANREVYILDFTYPRETLESMYEQTSQLVVLDHHASARDDCEGLPFCTFDMDQSGAALTHSHFGEHIEAIGSGGSDLIDFTEDYDLWHFYYPQTRPIHHYLNTLEMTIENWDDVASLIEYNFTQILHAGQAIEKHVNLQVTDLAQQAYMGKLPGPRITVPGPKKDTSKVLMANCPPKLASLTAEYLLQLYPDEPMVALWSRQATGKYLFNLRSRDAGKCDVSEVAKQYGGGGHPEAAGFRTTKL